MAGDSKWSKQPSQTVTYTSAHDNYTLYDKLVKSCKGGSGYGNRYDDLVAMNKLAGGIILTAQGISFFQAGEEFARTKYGDENSYKSPSSTNQLVWSNTKTYSDLMNYYKGLIQIRKAYSPFRDPTNTSNGTIYFSWANSGFPANLVAFTMYNKLNPGTEWDYVGVIHNAGSSAQTVTLMTYDDKTLPSQWVIIADGSTAGIKSLGTTGSTVTVPARSPMVLVDKTSFDRTVVSSGCKVTVNHVLKESGTTYKTETLNGKEGASYTASPLAELTDSGYKVSSVSGQTTGTFTKTGTTVTYYYELDTTKFATLTVKCQDAESGKSIREDMVTGVEIGKKYSVSPPNISGYECDPSLTANASGTMTEGGVTVIFKYHESAVETLKVHYYNASGWSTVYMYTYTGDGTTAVKLSGEWPGTVMQSEGSGWYVGSVNTENPALFIANAGAGGAQDPTGVGSTGYGVSGECWVKGGKVYPTGKVNVRYETSAGTLLDKETLKGMADGTTSYTTKSKTFDGYELVSTPTNASGLFTQADITVTYTYKSKSAPVQEVTNTSTVSSSSIGLGASVTVRCSASDGTAPYQYQIKYKADTASSYTTVQSYSTTSTATITPTAAGSYTISVTVKDASGKTKEKTFPLTVDGSPSPVLKNTSTVSSTTVAAGGSVTVTCAATGGTAPYQYGVLYKKAASSSYSTVQSYSSNKTVKVTLASATTYNIRVKIKDSTGVVTSKDFSVTATASKLVNNSTISAESIAKGKSVTITGAATGGSGGYQYAVYYKKSTGSSYSLVRDYSTTKTVTITPASVTTYNILVKVKDSKGTIAKKTFELTVTNAAANTSTVSATSVTLGQDITVKLSANGAPTPLKYAVYYKESSASSYTTGQAYSTNSTYIFTPQAAATYTLLTKVKDKQGTVYSKSFTIKAANASGFVNLSTVAGRTISLGDCITVNCSAACGTKPYKYSVLYKKSSSSSYITAQSNSTNKVVDITPSSKTSYTVMVKARDNTGAVKSKTFTIKVT